MPSLFLFYFRKILVQASSGLSLPPARSKYLFSMLIIFEIIPFLCLVIRMLSFWSVVTTVLVLAQQTITRSSASVLQITTVSGRLILTFLHNFPANTQKIIKFFSLSERLSPQVLSQFPPFREDSIFEYLIRCFYRSLWPRVQPTSWPARSCNPTVLL